MTAINIKSLKENCDVSYLSGNFFFFFDLAGGGGGGISLFVPLLFSCGEGVTAAKRFSLLYRFAIQLNF